MVLPAGVHRSRSLQRQSRANLKPFEIVVNFQAILSDVVNSEAQTTDSLIYWPVEKYDGNSRGWSLNLT